RRRQLLSLLARHCDPRALHSLPTRRSSDLSQVLVAKGDEVRRRLLPADQLAQDAQAGRQVAQRVGEEVDEHDRDAGGLDLRHLRSEEHTSELQSRENLVCRLLLEKKTYTRE